MPLVEESCKSEEPKKLLQKFNALMISERLKQWNGGNKNDAESVGDTLNTLLGLQMPDSCSALASERWESMTVQSSRQERTLIQSTSLLFTMILVVYLVR